jgi:hypothetical protein
MRSVLFGMQNRTFGLCLGSVGHVLRWKHLCIGALQRWLSICPWLCLSEQVASKPPAAAADGDDDDAAAAGRAKGRLVSAMMRRHLVEARVVFLLSRASWMPVRHASERGGNEEDPHPLIPDRHTSFMRLPPVLDGVGPPPGHVA